MIVALDQACILLDERLGIQDGDENGGGHIGQRQQATKRVSGMFLVIYSLMKSQIDLFDHWGGHLEEERSRCPPADVARRFDENNDE